MKSPFATSISSLKICSRIAASLCIAIVLSCCNSDRSGTPVDASGARIDIELNKPEKLRTAFAVVYSSVFAEVEINAGEKQLIYFDNNVAQSKTVVGVSLDVNNTISIIWYEDFEGSPLELARQEGVFFADSQTQSANIDLPYDFSADDNSNGTNNISERENGTCPRTSCNDSDLAIDQNLINARTNILGSWSYRYVATQCLEMYRFSSDGSFSQTSLDEELAGSYTIYPFQTDTEKQILTLTPTQDNLGTDCLGSNEDASTMRPYTFIVAFPSMDIMTWAQTSNPDFVITGLSRVPKLTTP